jgi:hypothetical protein
MKSQVLSALGLTAVIFCQLTGSARAMTADEATKLSQESGRPVLIVAGRHTCGNTMAVLGSLQERTLAPALSPYINVFVDVDAAEGRACQEKLGHPGDTLPFVYVVRADGEKLYSHSGVLQSQELREMLVSEFAKAGKILSAKDSGLLNKALEEAKRADKNGDIGAAVKSMLPLKKLGPLGAINCFTIAALEADKLVAKLTEQGKTMLQKVDEGCADGKPTLDAMLIYVKAKRLFAAMPTLKIDLNAAARKYEHRRGFADTLAQAEALDRAQTAAALPQNAEKAAKAFKNIVAAYPGTEVADRATEQLKKLSDEAGNSPAPNGSKPDYRIWTDSTGQHTIEARWTGDDGEKMVLETKDGRKIHISPEKLSEADRKFLESSQRKKE